MPDMEPLTLHAFPRAIVHIDGDAFFASCEQSRRPKLQGRPVITGKERGIAASMSYEAKARGVTRGMRIADIRKVCPDAVILPSDYETYSLLSKRFFAIVRRYTPEVEEYSVDECFADLTGLRRPLLYQIWQELNGASIFELVTGEHETYHTIQKVKTFTPPSSDRDFVFAQLAKNVGNDCIKLRKYKLATERVLIFLRSQDFRDTGLEMDLSRPTSFPNDILRVVAPAF